MTLGFWILVGFCILLVAWYGWKKSKEKKSKEYTYYSDICDCEDESIAYGSECGDRCCACGKLILEY